MTIAIARPLRVPRKMGTDWPLMAIVRQSAVAILWESGVRNNAGYTERRRKSSPKESHDSYGVCLVAGSGTLAAAGIELLCISKDTSVEEIRNAYVASARGNGPRPGLGKYRRHTQDAQNAAVLSRTPRMTVSETDKIRPSSLMAQREDHAAE
jgi:hypothetical protein